jgi:hypothetical protein
MLCDMLLLEAVLYTRWVQVASGRLQALLGNIHYTLDNNIQYTLDASSEVFDCLVP